MDLSSSHNVCRKTGRLANLDILRCVLMLFIVIWHIIVHGIGQGHANMPAPDFHDFWSIVNNSCIVILSAITSVSVNCYIILSGYLLANISMCMKFDKLFNLWEEIFFYSISIMLVLLPLSDKRLSILAFALPIANGIYWFCTQYFALILLSPFISHFAVGLEKKDFLILICILYALNFPSLPIIAIPYGSQLGSNFLWFVTLFLTGVFINKHLSQAETKKYYWGYFLSILFLCFLLLLKGISRFFHIAFSYPVLAYSGFVFIPSLFFFLIFRNIEITNRYLIRLSKVAPYVLSVYLIHDHPVLRNHLWSLINLEQYINTPWFLLFVLLLSFCIFSICILIDYLRVRISNWLITLFVNR